eukprot:10349233-Alexandrium_andersonii.AAC.1
MLSADLLFFAEPALSTIRGHAPRWDLHMLFCRSSKSTPRSLLGRLRMKAPTTACCKTFCAPTAFSRSV